MTWAVWFPCVPPWYPRYEVVQASQLHGSEATNMALNSSLSIKWPDKVRCLRFCLISLRCATMLVPSLAWALYKARFMEMIDCWPWGSWMILKASHISAAVVHIETCIICSSWIAVVINSCVIVSLLLREMYTCRSSGTKSSQGRCSRRDATSLIKLERLRSKVWCFEGHKPNACGLKCTLDCVDQE